MTNHSQYTGTCKFCNKPIYRYINRRPPGPWTHKDSENLHCWRNGEYNRDEVATPKERDADGS